MALNYHVKIDSTVNEAQCCIRHQIIQNVKKIFPILSEVEGPLWKSDEAQKLQGAVSRKGQYPDDPLFLFSHNVENLAQESKPDLLHFMRSEYVCQVMIP